MPQHAHTVAIQQVHSILLGARRRGLAVEPLLLRAGISPALLESPLARLSHGQYARLIRGLRRALRDELWGLLDRPLPPGSFGRCMSRLVHCATLGEALREGFTQYHGLLDDFVPRLVQRDGIARVQLVLRRQPSPAAGARQADGQTEETAAAPDLRQDYAVKAFLLLAHGAASWLVARRIPLLGVDYTGALQGSDTSRVYQAPVHAGQPYVGLSFAAHWLQLPVVQSPQSLREFLAGAPANLIIKYRDTSSLSERIRRLLRKGLGEEWPSLEDVSAALAVAPQTLRRKLREEGRGFQQLKDELRRDAAIELLLHTALALPEIAARLGFSEASTFHRAFKQWTGVAPGEYRLVHARDLP